VFGQHRGLPPMVARNAPPGAGPSWRGGAHRTVSGRPGGPGPGLGTSRPGPRTEDRGPRLLRRTN